MYDFKFVTLLWNIQQHACYVRRGEIKTVADTVTLILTSSSNGLYKILKVQYRDFDIKRVWTRESFVFKITLSIYMKLYNKQEGLHREDNTQRIILFIVYFHFLC